MSNELKLWRVPVYAGNFEDYLDDEGDFEEDSEPAAWVEIEATHDQGGSDSAIGECRSLLSDGDGDYFFGDPEEAGLANSQADEPTEDWRTTVNQLLNDKAEKDKVIKAQALAISALKAELRALGSALCSTASVALNMGREQ